jgi:mannitol-specific phosphotransferase system IIBC component
MNDTDTNKVTLALANSFLQSVTMQQALVVLQEKALERAKEEVEGMEDSQLEEILTNVRAQEIAQELKSQQSEETQPESSTEEVSEESATEES